MSHAPIPDEVRRLQPLITAEAYAHLRALQQHPHAPRWNYSIGDKVTAEDLDDLRAYRAQHLGAPDGFAPSPPPWLLDHLATLQETTWFYAERLADLSSHEGFHEIPPMERRDLATRLAEIVPRDADLTRLLSYETSGTTGAALDLPSHPAYLARIHVLGESVLRAYGVEPEFAAGKMACINVCAQQSTYTFANTFSVWNHATFAKVNLHEDEWPQGVESAHRFFSEADPIFLTVDPIALAEMMRWEIPARPRLIISTAAALSPGLQQLASAHFQCPVVDWYAATETGPIAFSAPDGRGYRPFSDDLYLELLDDQLRPVPEGEFGEVTVTTFRNPYLPLLRYRTGDRGRLEGGRLVEIEGRPAVYFQATDGSPVNPVDIARVLRRHCPSVLHEFRQRSDGSCTLTVRPVPGAPVNTAALTRHLCDLFGPDQRMEVTLDDSLGSQGKVIPYGSELSPSAR